MDQGSLDFVAEAISVSFGGNMQVSHRPCVAFQGYHFSHDGFKTDRKALIVLVYEGQYELGDDLFGNIASEDAGDGEIFYRAELFLTEGKFKELAGIALAFNDDKHGIEGYFSVPAEVLENDKAFFNECGQCAYIMGYGLNISTSLPDDKFGIYEKAWG